MGKEHLGLLLEKHTKVNGKTVKCMVEGYIFFPMAIVTMENGFMINVLATVYILISMVTYTKDCLSMECEMVKEPLDMLMETCI